MIRSALVETHQNLTIDYSFSSTVQHVHHELQADLYRTGHKIHEIYGIMSDNFSSGLQRTGPFAHLPEESSFWTLCH